MVTEYNRNLIMRRRMEAEKAAALLAATAPAVEVKKEKPVEVKKQEEKPKTEPAKAEPKKKTDAEKLKKKKA